MGTAPLLSHFLVPFLIQSGIFPTEKEVISFSVSTILTKCHSYRPAMICQ